MNNIFYIESFLEMMAAERGASPHTINAYRRDLLDVATFLEQSNSNLLHATSSLLHRYMASPAIATLSPNSSARKLSALRQFYQFLCSENHCTDNPIAHIDSPRLQSALPKMLSESEILTLLEAAYTDTSLSGIRLSTFLELLYATGLRVTELVSLPLKHVHIQADGTIRPYLTILGKGRKERIVPLNQSAIHTLKCYLSLRRPASSKWLFPSRSREGYLTRQRLGQLLKKLAVEAGLAPEKLSPHILRHSFASHLLHHGADLRSLQQLLGHATIATTQIYTHLLSDQVKSAVETHHPLGKNS